MHHATTILAPYKNMYKWKLPGPSDRPFDLSRIRMDERRFTLDVALGLLQARIWDEPELMHSVSDVKKACHEVRNPW